MALLGNSKIRVAVNGFGRIGRMALRAGLLNRRIEFVAINDLTDTKTLAHLLKYDSVHGIWPYEVKATSNSIITAGKEIKCFSEKSPSALPWKDLQVDLVIESTGQFSKKADASQHLSAGAKKVLITAPCDDSDITIVLGVNDKELKRDHKIISMASCTTNCLAPIAMVLDQNFSVKAAMMNTIHSYTNDQRILDLPHKDLRRARAAALNIIPTTTGATRAAAAVWPSLKGKMDGVSIRVPTPNVSLTDFVCLTEKSTSREEVNSAIKKASESSLKGIVQYSEEPLVSSDIIGNPFSAVFDSLSTQVVQGNLIRTLSWYDNEWGYSSRLIDLMQKIEF
ncbi:MAG: type I glyceraldehyde-3-phosphate dehydrogenase [Candidatus Diapherotrites archaeon]